MNWSIKNGVLFANGKRIVLLHVTSYTVDVQTIVVSVGVMNLTITAGAETGKLAAALDEYFTGPAESGLTFTAGAITNV